MLVIHDYGYKLFHADDLPDFFDEMYCQNALLVEKIDLGIKEREPREGAICFLAVQKQDEWKHYILVLALGYAPSTVFPPGILLVPETNVLFVGAGERVLVYNLSNPVRIGEDSADVGFLGWRRYGRYVVMSAELDVAVWDLAGTKLWSHFVEPPWDYNVEGEIFHLEVMEKHYSFPIQTGPQTPLIQMLPGSPMKWL